MNILILNGSPSGKNSVTLYTMLYIQKFFPEHTYEVLHVGQRIRAIERDFSGSKKALEKADLIVFCYPVYTFLVPSQLHRFVELMKESGVDFSGKTATQVTTSKHFYDITALQFIEDNCGDMGLRYIPGLSADMEDLLSKKGQKQALDFFRFVLFSMGKDVPADRDPVSSSPEKNDASVVIPAAQGEPAQQEEPENNAFRRIVIVTDAKEGSYLSDMIQDFQNETAWKTDIVDLNAFPFAGGCLGCFHCASDGTCVYKDGFDQFLRENIQSADAIVYAYTVKDHSMGHRFKLYDDRQFCNGHRTVTMGKPVGYLVDGDLSKEPNLMTLMQARAQVGGNFLAGIASAKEETLSEGTKKAIHDMAATLEYAIKNDYQPPMNFYGVGGMKIFRDLIYQMQGLMREDHRFYKKHGFYDFPQKHKGRIAAMYLVGGMMKNKKLQKKMGNSMTQGMIMAYKKVLKDADR